MAPFHLHGSVPRGDSIKKLGSLSGMLDVLIIMAEHPIYFVLYAVTKHHSKLFKL